MRKRTMTNLADHVFWLLVALLPLVLYVVQFFAYELTTVTDFAPFDTFMTTFGVSTSSVIYTSLDDLFGANGTLPLFSGTSSAPILFSMSKKVFDCYTALLTRNNNTVNFFCNINH